MEKFHKVVTVTDYKNLANLEPTYRLVASSHKVGTGHPFRKFQSKVLPAYMWL